MAFWNKISQKKSVAFSENEGTPVVPVKQQGSAVNSFGAPVAVSHAGKSPAELMAAINGKTSLKDALASAPINVPEVAANDNTIGIVSAPVVQAQKTDAELAAELIGTPAPKEVVVTHEAPVQAPVSLPENVAPVESTSAKKQISDNENGRVFVSLFLDLINQFTEKGTQLNQALEAKKNKSEAAKERQAVEQQKIDAGKVLLEDLSAILDMLTGDKSTVAGQEATQAIQKLREAIDEESKQLEREILAESNTLTVKINGFKKDLEKIVYQAGGKEFLEVSMDAVRKAEKVAQRFNEDEGMQVQPYRVDVHNFVGESFGVSKKMVGDGAHAVDMLLALFPQEKKQ